MERPGESGPRAAPSNPLLSTAVTGLRLQDLTHHAVLLPVLAPSDSQSNRPQNTPSRVTRAISPNRFSDGNANRLPTSALHMHSKPPTAPADSHKYGLPGETKTESKVSAKTDDDFDVNEYFARLQGTRYVSAPLNSQLKEDTNANLEETEDNLEEINLLEESNMSADDVQQSLTADIAQNFSQLPQVLPQVASAVFSSFSSILNLNKSREETPVPDVHYGQGSYGPSQVGHGMQGQVQQNLEGYTPTSSAVPMFTADSMSGIGKPPVGGEERSPAVVGPPPIGGAANTFRMTNKKKTYAHIPGLSTSEMHSDLRIAAFETNHPPKPMSSQQTNAAPHYYAPSPSTASTSLTMFDSNLHTSSTVPLMDISVATKDPKSEHITTSSAVMSEILETQLTDVLPSMAFSNVSDGNTFENHPQGGQVQDISDFSENIGLVPRNKHASFEKQGTQADTNVDLFGPSVPMGTLNSLQPPLIENQSMSVSWQTKSENFEHITNSSSSRLPSTNISQASTSMLLTPSNLPPSESLPQNISPSIEGLSQTPTAPLTEKSKEHIRQSRVVQPIDSLPRTGTMAPIGMLPPTSIANLSENFKSTEMTPSTKTLLPTGTGPPSEILSLIEMAPSSVILPPVGTVPISRILPPKVIAPPKGIAPPPGMLPPTANISHINASIDRAIVPPSLARKLSSKQSAPATPIGPGLNMFVPLVSNSNVQSTDASAFRYSSASGPQIFTPSDILVTSSENNPLDFSNPTSVPEMQVVEQMLRNKTDTEMIPSAFENVVPTPPTYFNPQIFEQNVNSNSSQILGYVTDYSVKQLSEEMAKPPLILPPNSAPSGQNFRLGNKKKLQYYSGPIDAIGRVGNTVKPVLTPIFPVAGNELDNVSLFTPATETTPSTQELKAVEQLNVDKNQGLLNTPCDTAQSQQHQLYETPFDLSRPPNEQDIYNSVQPFGYTTAEPYFGGYDNQREIQREESKPAALLGSLKSKLSSVNINKLQSAVTSFFDPAYYEPEKMEILNDNNTTNFSYGTQPSNVINFNYGPIHGPDSHFEVSVPCVDVNYPIAQQHQTPFAQNYGTPLNQPNTFEYKAQRYSNFQNYPPQPFNEDFTNYALTPAVSEKESLHTDGKMQNPMHDQNQTYSSSENILSYFSDKQQDNSRSSNLRSQTICSDHANIKNNKSPVTEEKKQDSVASCYIQDSSFAYMNQPNYSKDCDKNESENVKSNISKITSDHFAQNNPADFFGPECNSPLAIIGPSEKKTGLDVTAATSNTTERRCSHYKNGESHDQKTGAITSQLIENMTAPIQLFNPVEVPFTESSVEVNQYNRNIDTEQFDEISQITEETIKSIEIQSSIELLDNEKQVDNVNNQESNMYFDEAYGSYGWSIKSEPGPVENIEHLLVQECSLPGNNTNIGFKDDSFNIPRNASDEIKAELKHVSQEDVLPLVDEIAYNYFPRQMSIPTAPPIEYFSDVEFNAGQKSIDIRAGVLDVNLIEQDAKSDFPELDPYIIEPSETDDDKLESYKEKDSSEELQVHTEHKKIHLKSKDDIIKSLAESSEIIDASYKSPVASRISPTNVHKVTSPPVTFASYFDTGNYAADNYFRNVQISQNHGKNTIEPTPLGQSGLVGNADIIQNLESGPVGQDHLEPPPECFDKEPHINQRKLNTLQSFATSQQSNPVPIYDFEHLEKSCYESKIQSNQETSDRGNKIHSKHIFDIPAETIDSVCSRKSISPSNDIKQTTDPLQSFCTSSSRHIEGQESANPEPTFNLLASYFVTPPGAAKTHKPDPQKSFFELSEGQDHYMHEMQAHDINKYYPSFIEPASSDQLMKTKTELPPTPESMYECEKAPKTVYEQSQRDSGHIDNKAASTDIPNKILEGTPLSSQCTILDSKFVVNIPNVQPHFINISCVSKTKMQNVFKAETNVYNNDEIATNQMVSDINLSELSSYKAEYDATNLEATNKNIKDNPQLTDEIGYSMESNIGGEIEELFADYETKLAGIVNNCDRCCNRQFFDGEITDIESGVSNLDLQSSGDTGTVCGGEVMDADGNEKGKRVSRVNLKTKAGSNSRGAGASVSFKDSQNEDDRDSDRLEKNNAEPGQYRRVRPHWFYRLDREGKSIWRSFSSVDSDALEEAYSDPTLSEGTLVATDGGRFDVNILGRIRCPVYWEDKPTNVRRCSWFYKGTTDARYVPYTEAVADMLEEEYRRGCETGEWHRRIALPAGESVVLHSADVMVHFLQGSSPEAWGNTSPAVVRPRVVRRGADADEVEEGEPSLVDHLLLLCHGIGSACDLRFRPVEEVVDDFRATSSQLIQSHYRNSCESGKVGRVEVLPVSWHRALHAGEGGVDARLAAITLDSIPRLRGFTNDTVLDVLFYTSPVYGQKIINTVGQEMNRIYELFTARNPGFSGGVSLGGHSLGSLILFDLLRGQAAGAGSREEGIEYPQLLFEPRALFALGSPIAIFQCVRGIDSLGVDFALPTCPNFFNIFHPYDPVAYRVEPLIDPRLKEVPPLLIPHHKGRKRMHLELKETMARVGADLRARLVGSLRSTWASVWRAPPPPAAAAAADPPPLEAYQQQLGKVEEEYEGSSTSETECAADARFGRLNGGRRVDHVLQEAPFEIFNEYLFALTSHVCYWESEDTMLLILREIYGDLGVAPDSRVPQQTLSVEVERPTSSTTATESSRDRASTSGSPS